MKITGHGGKREGAGRKPAIEGDKRVTRNFSANNAEWQIILDNAEKAGKNISEFIRDRAMMK